MGNRIDTSNGGAGRLSLRIGQCAVLALLLAALSACTSIPLDNSQLYWDGVVERMPVSAPEVFRTEGPRCGRNPLVSGSKGSSVNGPAVPHLVGPGDVLKLNIFGEEGLTEVTAKVDADGFVQLPIVELVQVSGLGTREILALLKRRYSEHFNDT